MEFQTGFQYTGQSILVKICCDVPSSSSAGSNARRGAESNLGYGTYQFNNTQFTCGQATSYGGTNPAGNCTSYRPNTRLGHQPTNIGGPVGKQFATIGNPTGLNITTGVPQATSGVTQAEYYPFL